ncbi:DUF4136 domain-containing protein [Antarcticibacterium arcticum]|uniref:DUF4136 domain-containing protein n=1 Tax=Antarcticibacterium arcticum TaxID=2585771 RepID=A0A5B8YRQ4_9FLAO|nr:DUF4136 domain-containing protein [Antarcticibacterium arcticum]QED38839.1 DUF4136 domain-containing protein [Antarcticibacterium arcticum]
MKFPKYIIGLFLAVSCNTPQAVYDYDEKVNFTTLNTYQIYPDLATNLNQLDDQRIISILNEKLAQKGLRTSETPQIYVNFYSSIYETPNRNTLGVGVGGSGRNVGVGVSGGIPLGGADTYLRLTLDFIDVKNDALIWQAEVEGLFNNSSTPQKREESLRVMIEKALKGYPPKK